ncbi:SRPBCC domain-containing protein [Nocardioides carbamazepini]|uniref:SRPBCC domain-containing protein n=1 Tax=Nocardioides carbamazepini TaxID=2854259 RepID=UPI00214A796D|nr:SRPBCC domain-containing protein [Nocardioides carbamazepini]MCR1780944.1 SRPBCC domain-containing protein [Nocardioides carbamazepini]
MSSKSVQTVEAVSITRSVEIAASGSQVWAAITRSELIARWLGDQCEFDARPGGRGRFGWTEHGVSFPVEVIDVNEARRISFSWANEPGEDLSAGNRTTVVFELEEIPGGTRLTVTETGFDLLAGDAEYRAKSWASNSDGWRDELAELVAFAPTVELAA